MLAALLKKLSIKFLKEFATTPSVAKSITMMATNALIATAAIITEQCSKLLKNYLISIGKVSDPDRYVFSSQTHEHMTISCVEEVVKKYVAIAKKNHPTLFREKNYTPHTFRHSIAVHMLEAGIPLPVIKNFLGHWCEHSDRYRKSFTIAE